MSLKSKVIDFLYGMPLLKIFLLGALIRLLIYPFTGHWDTTSIHNVASKLFTDGPFSFYSIGYAIYPPLTYLTLGVWQKLISVFVGGDFHSWLSDPILYEFTSLRVFRYFFLLKLLYLPFDLGIGYILTRFFENDRDKTRVALFWLINPIVLYITSMWATVDVIPTFLILWAVYLLHKKPNYISFLLLAAGALFKMWPLLLVPVAALACMRTTKQKLLSVGIALGTFVIAILPYLRLPEFRQVVLSSDRAGLIGNAGLYLGFDQNLLIFLLLYVFVLFYIGKYAPKSSIRLPHWIFMILGLFYITSAFTPQWYLWFLPFLVLIVSQNRKLLPSFLYLLTGYILVILTFDAPLSIGLLAPVEPTLLDMPVLKEVVERMTTDSPKIWSIFRTIHSGTLLWFIYDWYSGEKKTI